MERAVDVEGIVKGQDCLPVVLPPVGVGVRGVDEAEHAHGAVPELHAAPVLDEDVALEDERDCLDHVALGEDVLPLAVVANRGLLHDDANARRDVHNAEAAAAGRADVVDAVVGVESLARGVERHLLVSVDHVEGVARHRDLDARVVHASDAAEVIEVLALVDGDASVQIE